MHHSHIIVLAICLGITGCACHTKMDNISDQIPKEFQMVIDSVHDQVNKDPNLSSEYFLFDITGDSIPELWLKTGTCEADAKLLAFTSDDGYVSKIYDGEGGHSDYFIFEGDLVSVMCNSGAGSIMTYEYDGKQVIASGVEFTTSNDEGQALTETNDSIADAKLSYWESNIDNFIEFKPLR